MPFGHPCLPIGLLTVRYDELMSHKLENYLRTHRRRAGLTQREVAQLLGATSPTKVSRFEHFRRQPTLETAFAYSAIFRVPVRALFAGTQQRVERVSRRRLRALAKRLAKNSDRRSAQKFAALRRVIE